MLVFMLAVLGITVHGLGVRLLLFPAYRYGYILLLEGLAIPADNPKLRVGDNFWGRTVCAIVQVALLANLLSGLPLTVKIPFSAPAGLLLTYSFAADLCYQFNKAVDFRVGKDCCWQGKRMPGLEILVLGAYGMMLIDLVSCPCPARHPLTSY